MKLDYRKIIYSKLKKAGKNAAYLKIIDEILQRNGLLF